MIVQAEGDCWVVKGIGVDVVKVTSRARGLLVSAYSLPAFGSHENSVKKVLCINWSNSTNTGSFPFIVCTSMQS